MSGTQDRIDVCPHCGSHDLAVTLQFPCEFQDDLGLWVPISDDAYPVASCNDCEKAIPLETTRHIKAPPLGFV